MKKQGGFDILYLESCRRRENRQGFAQRRGGRKGEGLMYREKQIYHEDRDYAVRSRRAVFDKEMESLKRLMYGGSVRIWPYMSDPSGNYSEERTVSFVEEIVNEGWYERMHRGDFERYSHKLPFYRKLLYCVLRILASDYTDYRNGNVIPAGGEVEKITFSDVADVFRTDAGAILDSFTIYFAELFYNLFTGRTIRLPFRDPYHEEAEAQQGQAERSEDPERQRMTESPQEAEEQQEMGSQQREPEGDGETNGALESDEDGEMAEDALSAWAEEKGLDIAELREEEMRELELGEENRRREEERLRSTFSEREHFCRNLEELALYAEDNPVVVPVMREELERLLVEFLSDRRLSVFDKEEAFVEAMVQLKKTIRTAGRYAED